MNKFLSLILTLISFNASTADIDFDNTFKYFTNTGSVENTYNMVTCNQNVRGEDESLETLWPNICRVVKKSELCKKIPKEDQLECRVKNYEENYVDVASFSFIYNCLWGAGEAIVDMFKYIGELVASTVKMTYDSEYRNKKTGEAQALTDSIMSYISIEYAKELDSTGSKFKASAAVVGSVTTLLFKGIADSLKTEFFELGCYNQEARQAKLCEGITSKLVPAYGALKILSKAKGAIKDKLKSKRPEKISQLKGSSGNEYVQTSRVPDFYKDEDKGAVFATNVEYLDKVERAPYEIMINKDGKLVDVMGDLIDTSKAKIAGGKKVGIYVMSPDGKIYMSNSQIVGKFHHSSFLSGGDVAVAGELIVTKGIIKAINRHSGHYKPEKEQLVQMMLELRLRKANLDTIRVDMTVPERKVIPVEK
jgi:hypothetical protein